ncbi:MAG: hypothetical protein R3F39_13050 [Myxococcota bacterium]
MKATIPFCAWAAAALALALFQACGGGGSSEADADISTPDIPAEVATDNGGELDAPVEVDGGCVDASDCLEGLAPCQTATCEAGACVVTTEADGQPCDDGDPCTTGDSCAAGVCANGEATDCDDGEFCTVDSCGEEGCVHLPASGPCDDGDICTSVDVCRADGTCGGQPRDCSGLDGPCTVGDCDGETGDCKASTLPDATACDDGDLCTSGEVCTAGACVGTPTDCSSLDGPCFAGVCDLESGVCISEVRPNGHLCDDGNPCSAGDRCVAGQCTAKGPVICNDGDPCNGIETCDSGDGGCKPGKALVCDDGNPCNGVETCNPVTAACQGGFPPFCDDGDACNGLETCDPATGSCKGGADAGCDDGNPCNGQETCDAVLGCLKGKAQKCDDLNPCTLDTCDAVTGCVHTLNPACGCATTADCASKDTPGSCDGTLVCISGLCQVDPTTVVPCNTTGDSACEKTVCNGSTGICEVQSENGLACSDGNPCTSQDTCSEGVCVGKAKSCANLDSACTIGVCQGASGACVSMPRNEGASCSDSNLCTTAETCQAGVCVGKAVDCSSMNGACTAGKCDPASGACVEIAANGGAACDTGDICAVGGKCSAGVCLGSAKDCSAKSGPCSVGSCDAVLGCVAVPLANGKKCSDGNACTVADVCAAGECVGAPADCSVLDSACREGYCDPVAGSCKSKAANGGAFCKSDTPCGGTGTCVAGACDATPVDCTSLTGPCRTGTCDELSGTCVAVPDNEGSGCNDGRACTTTDKCSGGICVGSGADCSGLDGPCVIGVCSDAGGCVAAPAPAGLSCDDGDACTVADACGASGCEGTPRTCKGSDACHSASCDPADGSCVNVAANDGAPCGAGNLCIEGGVCAGGTCAGDQPDCSDLAPGPCQVASCDAAFGSCKLSDLPNGTACDPGNPCAVSGSCSEGLCLAVLKDCSGAGSPDACLIGTCVGTTGACIGVPASAGAACNDSDPCTVDDACVGGVGGACVGTALDCSSLDGPCATGVCDPAESECVVKAANEGAVCGSADTCGTLTCSGAECLAGAVDCSAFDIPPCLAGQCNPASGLCQPVPTAEGQACDDQKACTSGEVCAGGLCKNGVAKSCAAGNTACSVSFCDPSTGQCKVAAINDSGACDDGDPCTTGDSCQIGACVGGDPVDCSGAGPPCDGFSCDPATGLCTVPAPSPDGASCDDGLVCNGTDTCLGAVCQTGAAPTCAELNAVCVLGVCDELSGGCVEAVADGEACQPAGAGQSCMAGTCADAVCVAEPVEGCSPEDATLLCELSGAQGDMLHCDITAVRTCGAVPPAASVRWTIRWDPAVTRLLYYTDRDQDPLTSPPAYSYPAYAPGTGVGAADYAPTADGPTAKHAVTVTPSQDFTAWNGEMTLAITDSTPPADPIADGALGSGGSLDPSATVLVMRAHFELLTASPLATPSSVHLTDLLASDLDGVPFAARLESGVLLLDYPQSVCP